MKAMVLRELMQLEADAEPLELTTLPDPEPAAREVLIEVAACGVCHTELDEIEGRTPPAELPIVLGHQVVGRVAALGADADAHAIGDRVGVGWIYDADGDCQFCRSGQENLCPNFTATGRDVDGGYAELMTVPQDYAIPIPDAVSDVEAAPLLCAGAIGYRSLRLCQLEDGQRLGLTGFGASGHLVLKMVGERYPNTDVYVFARNPDERAFAEELGAVWTGETEALAPEQLHAIIDTTPAWKPVVEALRNLLPGGRLVINAIRKEAGDKSYLLNLDYPTHLWMEKEIKSVANVTRRDIREFLELAAQVPIQPEVQTFPLEEANRALMELKTSKIRGAKVLDLRGGEA
jgi:propanol-preferring alcohol dehydrogenase